MEILRELHKYFEGNMNNFGNILKKVVLKRILKKYGEYFERFWGQLWRNFKEDIETSWTFWYDFKEEMKKSWSKYGEIVNTIWMGSFEKNTKNCCQHFGDWRGIWESYDKILKKI